ncbi:transcription factor tfiiic complex b box binding subunit sfc3 [Schizosaccharomyces octosporus yFS286]|uniref:Transcription factor tfiiic complex b box binding subunit sfc3 n=1 Tax=Schizosaccharomyces octosporus (strain yFS286) TaxID=483514 RepID=S9PSR7_SCHOY|nr:transcription factor tfiiic complex b box binding subunit sfc3 [Schizosaccharomyces octosporus yFS286]EPX71017.1 transcription factor tfiiic complex b box binding subunit sfc3 [Schizosaccharomyces octosporus yFS286]
MDSLIRYCSEEIALDGSSGCDIDRLWSFAENFYFRRGIVQNLDDDYKGFIWPVLLQEDGIELWIEDANSANKHQIIDSIPWNYQEISPFFRTQLRLFASVDRQWITLTYKTKADSKIQPLAFELLSCISRYRHEGIDRIQLCKETRQEPRSVFGRIQALEDASLISKVSISRSKAQTALLVLKRFESENSTMNESVAQVSGGQVYNTDKIRHQICSVVQEFKNGVCRHVDARTKVGLNQNKWERRYFSRQTSYLHNNGYIRKCLTFLPNSPDRYIRCLQFLKHYPMPTSENFNQDMDLSDADDNVEEEDLEDEESQIPIKGELDSAFLQPLEDESLMVPQWSRFNPLEFQCYVAVRNSGLDGLITLRILQKLTGLKFNKPLFKVLGSLVENKSSVPDYLSHLVLTRIEDKTNKSRQYRYFTLHNQIQRLLRDGLSADEITKIARNVHPTAGEFPPYNTSLFKDANTLSNENNSSIYSPDGMTVLPKKRGRPKKGTPKSAPPTSSPIKQENSLSVSVSSPVPPNQLDFSSSQGTPSNQPSLMVNSDSNNLNSEASVDVNDNNSLPSRPSELDSLFELSLKSQREDALRESLPPPKSETSILDVPYTPFGNIDMNINQILPNSSENSILEDPSTTVSNRPRQVVDFVMLQRKSLIMAYLEEKNGAFEISKNMYEDLADLKVRRDPNSVRTVMDRRTLRQTLDKLLHEKKVRKVVIAFENGFGKLIRKDIIVRYNMKSDDPRLYDMKHQMMRNESEFRNDKDILRGVEIDIPDRPRSKRRKQALPVEEIKARRESRAFEKNIRKQKEKEDPMELAQKLLESLAPTLSQPVTTEESTLESQPLSKASNKVRKDRYAPLPELDYYPSATHSSKRSVKRFKSDFTAEEDDTLIRAVVIIQVQYGGVHRNIKWEAVQKCFPSRDITSLSRRYISIRQHTKYKSLQQFLLANWTRMYQDAVTRGDLESYPENADSFDPMPSVKASYRPYIISSSDISSSNLPDSLEQLYEKYDVEMVKDGKDPKDLLFDTSLSAMARMNIYSDIPFIKPIYEDNINNEEEEKKVDLTTLEAKSTIKSILAIPDSDYDSRFAQSRLLKFPEEVLLSAHNDLIRKDIVARVHSESNRVQPGRNYHFTDKFANSLKSPFPPFLLLQAPRFYNFLADGFREGKSHMIQEACNSGTVACVLDLFSRGKVEASIINSKFNEFGLAEGYRTRLLEHENIKMDLILSKKANDSFEPIDSSSLIPPPSYEPRLWLDGNKGTIDQIWLEIKQAIIYQLLRRPGIQRKELGRILSPGLDDNELREIIEYFLIAGAAIEKNGLFLNPGFYQKLI